MMILGTIGLDPSLSKSDQLHIDIFLGFSLSILKMYSIDSS